MKFKFIKSAVYPKDYPIGNMPEVGIVGRSNSGKSSLVNAWMKTKIAKVSSAPGKTRLLNFFSADEKYRLVDMPGYGFSKRTEKERQLWEEMIETYLSVRAELKGLMLIMDIRRAWSADEQMVLDWAAGNDKAVAVILNKADKTNQKERHRAVKNIQNLGLEPFVISAKTGKGVDGLIQAVWTHWILGESPK